MLDMNIMDPCIYKQPKVLSWDDYLKVEAEATIDRNQLEIIETPYARHYNNLVGGSRVPRTHLDVCVPKKQAEDPQQAVWLVYIHGGAWRDPMIDRKSFNTALELLLKEDRSHNIAGFVTLDYRLSPYPTHPTCPSLPEDPSRNVQHSVHVVDVYNTLVSLMDKTRRDTLFDSGRGGAFGSPDLDGMTNGRYVLCGHSCGASLAVQATALLANSELQPPAALLGIEGIYDIPALVATHTHPAYREFVTAAFGEDEKTWISASPANISLRNWEGNVMLVQSNVDELVDMQQTDSMVEALVMGGWQRSTSTVKENKGKQVSKVIINCLHDEVWEKGTDLARAIRDVTDTSWVTPAVQRMRTTGVES
ncbi:alpha/beta-hydrolase [Aureobasidium subglaciale]|nr:alpha/beta-hydrolase [Aureobasidium subglaciale]